MFRCSAPLYVVYAISYISGGALHLNCYNQ